MTSSARVYTSTWARPHDGQETISRDYVNTYLFQLAFPTIADAKIKGTMWESDVSDEKVKIDTSELEAPCMAPPPCMALTPCMAVTGAPIERWPTSPSRSVRCG